MPPRKNSNSPAADPPEEEHEKRPRSYAIGKKPELRKPQKPRSNSFSAPRIPLSKPGEDVPQNPGGPKDKQYGEKQPAKQEMPDELDGAKFLKIIELASDAAGNISEIKPVKATIYKAKLLNFPGATLEHLRKSAGAQLKPGHKFCYQDGSVADDGMLLRQYLETVLESQPSASKPGANQAPDNAAVQGGAEGPEKKDSEEIDPKAGDPEQKEPEQKESEQKEPEQKEPEKDSEEKDSEEKDPEKKEPQNGGPKKKDAPKKDAPKKDAPKKDAPKKPKVGNIVYVWRPQQPSSSALLLSPPFVMKIFEWKIQPGAETEKGHGEGRGSIHSNSFGDVVVGKMTLAGLRKRVSGMSAYPRVHRFCTPAGTTVEDESLTVADYLSQESADDPAASSENKSTPIIKVYYKLNQSFNQPHVKLDAQINTTLTGYTKTSKALDAFASKMPTAFGVDVTDTMKDVVDTTAKGAGYLTEADWDQVFRNCSLLFGWYIDRDKNCIRQAPKQAFQLKTKRSDDPTSEIPDFLDPDSASNKNTDTTNNNYVEKVVLAHLKKPEAGVFSSTVTTGSTQVEAGNTGVTEETTVQIAGKQTGNPSEGGVGVQAQSNTQEEVKPNDNKVEVKPKIPTITKREMVMPSFQVNDDSRIEVIITEHEFETSLAKNDFNSMSIEGSMSGGYGGFSATVSAGFSKAHSHSKKELTNTYQKTIIAKYLFPRATVHLHPDDLEPTPELAKAIARIEKDKNIKDLRKLHQDFGHLFCKSVTLGGRLLSSKIMAGKETGTENERKDQFKTSVGLQVQTPVGVGAGVKNENETGSGSGDRENKKDKDEKHVFEAVGGDTTLAATPGKWVSTVGNEKYWRVINREGLYPLAEFISSLPGLEKVSGYFMMAVPALAKYIEMPPSREIKARFKLLSPTTNLSIGSDALYYLGHEFGCTTVMPSLNGRMQAKNDIYGYKVIQVDYLVKQPLFSPSTTRAPVLQGYSNNFVGDKMFGTSYTKEFLATAWSVVAPFDEALKNGTRVVLRTVPFENQAQNTESKPNTGEVPVSLVVYRNQQGHFLPSLSDAEDFQYWRIWKNGARNDSKDYIKEGDEIRFSWSFDDQTTGFRDYYDDVFGRRRVQLPPGLSNTTLWLKLPFPRFESMRDGYNSGFNSMIMAPVSDTNTATLDLRCIPAKDQPTGRYKYDIEDVLFRIDMIANDGRGDADDYMLKDVQQNTVAASSDLGLEIERAGKQLGWTTKLTEQRAASFYL
ncbi:hypothetical protein TWF481_003723 [Arthrobotrys musiformis]|uniref:MACPF domain-containing protein n=1 Tax=Arthrobotrys musiformis TaxID=47236 RepID=A0AAV9WHW1_9PEZI